MDQHPLTIALQDDSPGYEISPARVPLATLASFASEVRDFLKGSGRDADADAAEVAVVHGSLAVQARDFSSPSLVHDLRMLETSSDISLIDPKRRAVVQKWQSAALKKGSLRFKISTPGGQVIAITNQTKYRAESERTLVHVEQYIRGEVVDLGGVTQANAHIKLPDGKTLVVQTDRNLIRAETENHLYKEVHLRIRAHMDLATGELIDAQLLEFVHYEPKFDQQQFSRLTRNGEEAWKDVVDPAAWVRQIRGEAD
ncbi:hypothetical protein [Caballeronia novacaledonica]|uniref:Uncharacterized protein n=1 Tax=Caballeronia novacaledonica TaxID=1544861 RepID=A0AA37IIL0_9BURK|nr:hypothetical protein [Caballeronia novacaledonica]GJH29328.1 hypothetical protein CBA19CS42_32450 [Caballeronia novacaledonica]